MNSYQRILVPGLLILLVSGISAQDKKARNYSAANLGICATSFKA